VVANVVATLNDGKFSFILFSYDLGRKYLSEQSLEVELDSLTLLD